MSYVLGFFAADGNLIKNKRGACFFSLEICDLNILKKIRTMMGSDHKIGKRGNKGVGQRRNIYRLQLGSIYMYRDLLRLGFSTKKTKNMSVLKVPLKYFPDFVRGYFDGDGNVWVGFVHKRRNTKLLTIHTVFTSGSGDFLKELQEKLISCGVGGGSFRRGRNYFRLQFSILDSIMLYHLMYDNLDSGLYLARKKKIFDRYIKMRS